MEKPQVIQLYELPYADLVGLTSSSPSTQSPEEIQRLGKITRNVMECLGPTGPGLIGVSGVPEASRLRQRLLPLARKLSLLSNDQRKRILKEHNLGSDVPLKILDRIVSSFAMQLKYKTGFGSSHDHDLGQEFGKNARSKECLDGDFENLESSFKELGHIMMEIGVHLAKICDRVIGFHELEDSLLESCTAKGRLIHYHSRVDNSIIQASLQKPKLSRQKNDPNGLGNGIKLIASKQCGNSSNLWQQWHYDYGIFTVLTAPMFMLGNYPEVESGDKSSCIPSAQKYKSPSGHTCLQIFHPEKNCTLMVKASPESFIVQVGEAADVLSKGKLRATLHSVCRPAKPENLSRETFVVFLQPSWSKFLSLSDYPIERLTFTESICEESIENSSNTRNESAQSPLRICNIIPPLSSRLKDGMTFAQFSKETTKQYYGTNGLQSKR
ncbi:oxidoreductase [Lithospermum erythrorhizon]|uniref:Oxidoreductase n=1 Tax=Lithospermum erythrorhizon TaxID=34254 RepID=A0AAV3Q249_LITER